MLNQSAYLILCLFLDSENPYLPVVIDHNTVYFIDVNKNKKKFFIQIFFLIIFFKSYIHSKVFLLTIDHNHDSILKLMSIYKIQHCFFFQENSHHVNF
jgi:hypothetical protein